MKHTWLADATHSQITQISRGSENRDTVVHTTSPSRLHPAREGEKGFRRVRPPSPAS